MWETVQYLAREGESVSSFFDVFRGSKNRYKNGTKKVTKMGSKRDPKSEPKSPKWAPKALPKEGFKKASKNDHFQHP